MQYRVISKIVDESIRGEGIEKQVQICLRVHGEKYPAQFSDINLQFVGEQEMKRAEAYQIGQLYRLTPT